MSTDADLEGIKRSVQGEFFWFRKDGKEFIVQDPATARARAPGLGADGKDRRRDGKARQGNGPPRRSHGQVRHQMALAAATFNKDKMEAIGKQMEEAGKPMEALGKKMEVLGEQMEAQQKDADRTTRGIIGEALASGVARPAPRRG
jgi:hypothetical protein